MKQFTVLVLLALQAPSAFPTPPLSECDGKTLALAVKTHFAYQHPVPETGANSCEVEKKTPEGFIICKSPKRPEPQKDEPENFSSWEVCGDEYMSNYLTVPVGSVDSTYQSILGATVSRQSPKELREMADCIERREAKEKRRDVWRAKIEKQAETSERFLWALLGKCGVTR